jgi:hypothetical protein
MAATRKASSPEMISTDVGPGIAVLAMRSEIEGGKGGVDRDHRAQRHSSTMESNRQPGGARKKAIGIGVAVVLLAVAGFVAYGEFTLHFAYSKGERVGFVQKLSKRGWICKTNEGDLAMVNIAGQQAQMFSFTVPDDAVAAQIESFAGHRVVLEYEEHDGVPSRCFGDTPYFVVSVKKTD